jgi:Fe-S oxidoreductase
MPNGGDYNWCCGGGGGVITIKRADELRHRVFKLKMDQMEATGAEELLSSCANCRQSFDDSEKHFGWNHSMGSLMEMVAENLEEQTS